MQRQVRGQGSNGRAVVSAQQLAVAQAGYYIATGLWPLISMRTFERMTGPKADKWLVKTVGVLVAVIGTTLLIGGARRQVTPELKLLAVASAAGLTGIDIVYAAKRRISPVYLVDAALETIILGLWEKTHQATQKGIVASLGSKIR